MADGQDSEIYHTFSTYEQWMSWIRATPSLLDKGRLAALVAQMREGVIACPFCDYSIPGVCLSLKSSNYREELVCEGINSRLRAVLFELEKAVAHLPRHAAVIYAPEAVTPFALLLRGLFPRFIGSEFTADEASARALFPIRSENLLALTFADASFHAVVVNDVLEHVPDSDLALSELARVTKPGGTLIATFPFNMMSRETLVKARLSHDGQIAHLCEPEYHGDPMSENGSLVFEIPGWDILSRAEATGWSAPRMVYHRSVRHGIIAGGCGGILVMTARRAEERATPLAAS